MKLTTVVFAHGAVLETVNRHFKFWDIGGNILFVSPSDDPCVMRGFDCLTYGRSEHDGLGLLSRIMMAMRVVLLYGSDYYIFHEYDSFSLRRIPLVPFVQGNLINERIFLEKELELMRLGKCFMHFPWVWPRSELERFVGSVSVEEGDYPYPDGWIAQRLLSLDMKVSNLHSVSYSKNTILESDFPKMSDAIAGGAYVFHGVKSREVLERIMYEVG